MTTLTHPQYIDWIKDHLSTHGDWKVSTSPLKDNTYYKNYICDDGYVMTEVNRAIYETHIITVHGIEIPIDVHLWQCELFGSDFESIYTYEEY